MTNFFILGDVKTELKQCLATRFQPMLDQYIGEDMVTNNLSMGIKITIPSNNNGFGGYHLKVRKSLYTRVRIWVNTILNYNDTRAILHGCKGSWIVYRLNW